MSKENYEKLNLEEDIPEQDITKFIEITNSQNLEIWTENIVPFNNIYTPEDIKQTRAALAILYPEMKLENDENIYEHIKNESYFLRYEEYNPVKYFNNAIWAKIIYPKYYEKIFDGIAHMELHKHLSQQIELFEEYNHTYELYRSLRDFRILFPYLFNAMDIQEVLGINGWEEKIYKEIDYIKLINTHPEETLADFIASVNFVEYPRKLEIDEYDWNEFKQNCKVFRQKGNREYPYIAEYLANLKIIAARDIYVTDNEIIVN